MSYQTGQNITKYLGYLSRKICHQELSKISKSGHTDFTVLLSPDTFTLKMFYLSFGFQNSKFIWNWRSCLIKFVVSPAWPEVTIKSSPNFPQVVPKVDTVVFYLKSNTFLNSPKSHQFLGTFLNNFAANNFEKQPDLFTLSVWLSLSLSYPYTSYHKKPSQPVWPD